MGKSKKQMPLIIFKGIVGRFVSLNIITDKLYADGIPYYTNEQYELTMITEDDYTVNIKPIKQEDADRIVACLKCSRGKKVKCWR